MRGALAYNDGLGEWGRALSGVQRQSP